MSVVRWHIDGEPQVAADGKYVLFEDWRHDVRVAREEGLEQGQAERFAVLQATKDINVEIGKRLDSAWSADADTYSDGCVGEHQGCAYAQATSPEPHLPECRAAGLGLWPSGGLCICDELRACEQRVLDAARDAVAGIPSGRYAIEDASAAIDALRGES